MIINKANHIKEKSGYNHNYYSLDEEYQGCSVVCIRHDDISDGFDADFGDFDDTVFKGGFRPRLFAYGEPRNGEYYIDDDVIQETPYY